MKKILFISVRDPFSERYSGDVIRSKKFVQYLLKKNHVEVICLGSTNKVTLLKKLTIRSFKRDNPLQCVFNIFISLFKFRPLHFSFFHSSEIKEFINNKFKNFDIIFCQSLIFNFYRIKYKRLF